MPPGRAWLVAGCLALGAMVRVGLSAAPGTPDVGNWKVFAFAGRTDPTALYGVGGHPPGRRFMHWNGVAVLTEYPPMALYELSAAGELYAAMDPLFSDSPLLTRIVKLPGFCFEALFVGWLLTAGRRWFGDSAATWMALAYWRIPR